MTANADTAVWLHTHKHTTAPAVVPESHPCHVVIVQLLTGTNTGYTQQWWADRWADLCTSMHDGLRRPSLTGLTVEGAPNMAESHTGAPPPHQSLGLHAHTPPLGSRALKTTISSHQGLIHTPHDNTQ